MAPIIILGMHRSGTSLVAGLLHSVGVSMGTVFLEPDRFNSTGYFEDIEFLYINKGILENSGGSWFSPPTLANILEGGRKFNSVIAQTVKRKSEESNGRPWGWKDPRMCLVSWIYTKHIPDAKYLVVVRNRRDTVLSLKKAHGDKADWKQLIKVYGEQIDKFLSRVTNPFMVVTFEELVYKKYFAKKITEILNFAEVPRSRIDIAAKFVKFR